MTTSTTTLLLRTLLLTLTLFPPTITAQSCRGKRSYILTLKTTFSRDVDLRIPQPDLTSIPTLVAVAHPPSYTLFRPSRHLTDPVAEIASKGTTTSFRKHLSEQPSDTIPSFRILDDLPAVGTKKFDLVVRDDATRISIMFQLSPSPAWFVGLDSFNVCQKDDEGRLVHIQSAANSSLRTYNAGLQKGQSFLADPDPYDNVVPVAEVSSLSATLATVSLEQGSLSGSSKWPIILGVVIAILAVAIFAIFVFPRLRRRFSNKQKTDLPLASEERVDW